MCKPGHNWINDLKIDTVIDVGASIGDFLLLLDSGDQKLSYMHSNRFLQSLISYVKDSSSIRTSESITLLYLIELVQRSLIDSTFLLLVLS